MSGGQASEHEEKALGKLLNGENHLENSIPSDDKERDGSTDGPILEMVTDHRWLRTLQKIPGIGMAMALLFGVFSALMGVEMQSIRDIPILQTSCISSLVAMILTLLMMIVSRLSPLGVPEERRLLALRALFSCGNFVLILYSFTLLPLSDAVSILATTPAFASIFSCVYLKEPCGCVRVVSVLGVITGVVLVARPTFIFPPTLWENQDQHHVVEWPGVLAALTVACLQAAAIVTTKKMYRNALSVILFPATFFTALVSAILLFSTESARIPQSGIELLLVVAIGITFFAKQICTNVALKLEEAGTVAITQRSEVVVAVIMQVFWLGEHMPWTSAVGSSIILICLVLLAWHTMGCSVGECWHRLRVCCCVGHSQVKANGAEQNQDTSNDVQACV